MQVTNDFFQKKMNMAPCHKSRRAAIVQKKLTSGGQFSFAKRLDATD